MQDGLFVGLQVAALEKKDDKAGAGWIVRVTSRVTSVNAYPFISFVFR